MPRVRTVAQSNPKITAIAKLSHIGPPPSQSGSSPPTVVTVFDNLGRSQRRDALITARPDSKPFF